MPIGMAVTVLISVPFSRRMRRYRLGDYEWVQFYSKLIIGNIEEYEKEKNPELRSENKKKAVKLAEELLSHIRAVWQIGSFQLVKNYVGESVSDFIASFQNKVIPNLKEMNENSADNLEAIMRNLFFESKGIKLESIEHLNQNMAELDDVTVTPTRIARLQGILRTTRREHGFFIVFLIILWSMLDSLALYVGLPIEVIYSTTIVGAIAIVGIYISKKKKAT